MITTVYKFEANINEVIKLKKELVQAKLAMAGLKKETLAYKAASKNLSTVSTSLNKATASAKKANDATKKLTTSGRNMMNTFKSAAIAIAAAFAFRAIVGGLKNIVVAFKEFEAQMAAVEAISGATKEQFDELKKSALEYGKSTVFTATQVAKLQEEFARLGFTSDEIIQATRATLDLSAATGESLANSAQIAGSTLRAFNMDASLTKEVTDTMAAAFTSSALNLERFTESMKFVAPVAAATGFTLQETTALLANLADNGIKGSIAGNALKNIFLKLGDANSKLAKQLGGPVQGLDQLAVAMESLKEQGFGATEAVALLDKRSAPAFLALIKNIEGMEESVEILNNAEGATARMAAIRLDTLQGDMTLLSSAAEGLSIAFGDKFDVTLREAIHNLTKFLQVVSKSDGTLNAMKFALELVGVAIAGFTSRLVAVGIASFVTGVGSMIKTLGLLVPALRSGTVAMAAFNASTKANIFVAAITAIGALGYALYTFTTATTDAELAQRRLNESILAELDAVIALEEGTTKRAVAIRQLKDNMGEYGDLIDLEILSERELLELRTLLENQSDKNNQNNKDERKLMSKKIREQRVLLELEADLLRMEEKGNKAFAIITKERIAVFKKSIKEQEDGLNKIKQIRSTELSLTEGFQRAALKGDDTFRKKQRELNAQLLKDFRELDEEEQKRVLKTQEAKLEAMTNMQTFANNMIAKQGTITKEQLDAIDGRLKILKDSMDKKEFAELSKEFAQIADGTDKGSKKMGEFGIEISLLESLVNKLGSSLKTTSKELGDGDGNFGLALRKTKNLIDKLSKSMFDAIKDAMTKESIDLSESLKVDKAKLKVETDMVLANMEDIQTIQKEGDLQIISDTIEKNKKKFDVLKVLSAEELAILTSGKEEHREKILSMLDKLNEAEREKLITNDSLEQQLQTNFNKKKLELEEKNIREIQKLEDESNISKLEDKSKTIAGLLKNFSEIRKLRATQLKNDLADSKKNEEKLIEEQENLRTAGKISEEDYEKNITRIHEQGENDRYELTEKAADKDAKLKLKQIEKIKEIYQSLFNSLSMVLDNMFELQRQKIEETTSAQSEDLNAELEGRLDALEGNEQAQEDIKAVYALKEEDLEAKKQVALRKIKYKEFLIDKANALIMAYINGAEAITKVSGQTGVAAIVAAPIMAALIAVQIAAIASQKFVGALGGLIPGGDDKFAKGGMVHGPSHANGGVKFAVGGRVAELEGGEAVINKRSTRMFHSQLSDMNVAGGGKRFAEGGITGALQATATSSSSNSMSNLANQIVNGINNKTVTVSEADITSTQNNVNISELTSSIF